MKEILNNEHELIKWVNVTFEVKKALMANLIYKQMESVFHAAEKNSKKEGKFEFLNAKKSTFKNSLVAIQ